MICEICGKEFDVPYYSNKYKNICSSKCFEDKFWQDIIKEKDEHVVIKGECYYFDKSEPIVDVNKKAFVGFSGRRFKIKMLDTGEIIETNNLWNNGTVAEKFREQLPDNAEFVK